MPAALLLACLLSLQEAILEPPTDAWAHLQPGALPADAAPEARAAWARLLAATLAPDAERRPLVAFDVEFEVQTRDGVQTNEATVRHRFLAPHFVRTRLASGREQGRGPDGYWLLDPEAPAGRQAHALEGREYTQDRRAIDDVLALSRNVVALASPGALRIASLALLTAPPLDELPPALRASGAGLEWLAFVSPDFGLPTLARTADTAQVAYEVRAGLERASGEPRLVLVRQHGLVERADPSAGLRVEGLLLDLQKPRSANGYRLPSELRVHTLAYEKAPGEERLRTLVEPEPGEQLWVLKADLAPALAPESFKAGT